jgi:CPA2 family monovalent cation:H+ antiporter-2
MESILFIIFVSLAIATVLNLFLKKLSVSHIIGYIITGTIISNLFGFNNQNNLEALDLIAEFGIVFLMFTIGLEMSFTKLKRMKELLLVNGFLQVSLSAVIIFMVAYFIFNLSLNAALIISLAFSLSSTAIVLSYLKQSKDIHTPYGQKVTAMLIFQDLAVIPILLLIGFLSNDTMSLNEVLTKTLLSAIIIIVFMFTIGKKAMNWLLHFSSHAKLEELFLGSVLCIVIGASLLAHALGFTYSLGAFIAGMIIAETSYHVKVESDIASYKDLLLGAFFFSVGTKIDMGFFIQNLFYALGLLIAIMFIKAVIIYFLIRRKANKNESAKAALALCQIGEFSFAIFALASNNGLLGEQLGYFLILITVLSMIITPFIINNIYKLASLFAVEFFESDKITPIEAKNHTIICGFSTLGRIVATSLQEQNQSFVIISDDLRHVLLARKRGYMAYFGHLDKLPVLESLKADEAKSIILTLHNTTNKRLICEAVLKFDPKANLIVKVDTTQEKKLLKDLHINHFVHAHQQTAKLIVEVSKQ